MPGGVGNALKSVGEDRIPLKPTVWRFVDAAWNRAQLPKIKPWTRQRVEAFKFLNALTKDYTPRAVYEAAKEVDGGHQDRVERASRRQLMKVIMQAVA